MKFNVHSGRDLWAFLGIAVAGLVLVACPSCSADGGGKGDGDEKPFPQYVRAPSLDGGLGWLNTAGPIEMSKLKGKVVLLDFWTYCCINCMHILPDLAKLEAEFPNELVVIGVHSAKFPGEQVTENIRDAVIRYEIKHPVVNDGEMRIWQRYGVNAWPTRVLIDPEGYVVGSLSGEGNYEALEEAIRRLIKYNEKKGTLDRTPLHFELESFSRPTTSLKYPGKLLVDPEKNRLIISDSGHHRVVIVDPATGETKSIIGSGKVGLKDGSFEEAEFNEPQGLALQGDVIYVADRRNHAIRAIDLVQGKVSTAAGTGKQGFDRRASGPALETDLASPWALLRMDDQLYIAMAGTHQIWRMNLSTSSVEVFAGSGRENIDDGRLFDASFAQPSGLAAIGETIYVADSETSSIRAINLKDGSVETVVGRGLFVFADTDGIGDEVRLQHALGIAAHGDRLFVADTYNNKIKVLDPKSKSCETFVGDVKSGSSTDPPRFDEPAGLSLAGNTLYVADTNNHAIRVIDLETKKVTTLAIKGLSPPPEESPSDADVNSTAKMLDPVILADSSKLAIKATVPVGEKQVLNPKAPMSYRISKVLADGTKKPIAKAKTPTIEPTVSFEVAEVDLADAKSLEVAITYYPCDKGAEGVCRIATQVWSMPVSLGDAGVKEVELKP